MDTQSFISIWGSRAALARAINEGETTVRNWFIRGSIPRRYDDKIIVAAAIAGRLITPADLHALSRSLARTARGAPEPVSSGKPA